VLFTMEADYFGAGHGERPDALTSGERHRHTLSGEAAAMLAAARKRSGWSVRQAAARVRVASGTIGMLETAARAPSRVVADRLVAAYQLTEAEAALLLSEAVSGVGYDYRRARNSG
jgi:ribosome-binding protein aMBF1 (putative translation factor)